MRVTLRNFQDPNDPLNGRQIVDADELDVVLDRLQSREPLILELEGENGYRLTIGIGGPVGCAQYASASGEPPYLIAASEKTQSPVPAGEYVFLCGDQETVISAERCIPNAVLRLVATHFLKTGERSAEVKWVEV